MSIHRLPDGSTVFLCGRGNALTPEQRAARWVKEEAAKQGRCSRCLSKIGDGCAAERSDLCANEAVTGARAVAILRGMVQG